MRGATPTSIQMSLISSAARPSGRFFSIAMRRLMVSFSSLSKASWAAWRFRHRTRPRGRRKATQAPPPRPRLVASWRSSLSTTWVAALRASPKRSFRSVISALVDLRDLDLHLRLAGLLLQLPLGAADLLDLLVGDIQRVEDLGLGDLVRARLDHEDGLLRARYHQVERALEQPLLVGVDDEVALLVLADAHGADGERERDVRHHQRGARAVHREDVVGDHVVDRHRDRHQLRLTPPPLGEERAQRAVDHAGGQRALLAGASLALEEAAGDLCPRRTCAPPRRRSAGESRRP